MSNPPYEILEHTADIGLRIYGKTLPELFRNAAMGLMSLAAPQKEMQVAVGGERLALRARGADLEELLVGWLSEILYFVDAEGWTFFEFRVAGVIGSDGAYVIEGEGLGERRDPTARSQAVPVKAVTYHQVAVRETGDGWEAVVYFDI